MSYLGRMQIVIRQKAVPICIGQKDSVNCYYLLGRRTIDQKLYRIIEEKKHISNAVLGAEDNIQTNIVDTMANLFDTNEEEE